MPTVAKSHLRFGAGVDPVAGRCASSSSEFPAGAVDLGACMWPRIVQEGRGVENLRVIASGLAEWRVATATESHLRRRGCRQYRLDANLDANAAAGDQLCWADVVNKLNLVGTPFLKPIEFNTLKARREYNKLVSDEDQLGARTRVPGVGILRAVGLNDSNQHLAKQFGALLIAANARHLVAGGAITDIIIFRTSGGGSPAALVTEAGLAAVRATADVVDDKALRAICKPPGKRKFGQQQQPLWEKMNVMAILGIEDDFLTGMPLLDTRAVTNADSGLLKEEQDAFLSSLSHLLHDLAASLKPQSKVHPGARAAEFFEHLECTFENQPTVSVCVHVDCSSTLNILQLLWMLFIGLCLYHIYFVGVGKFIYSYM